jgi:hypothetical protein
VDSAALRQGAHRLLDVSRRLSDEWDDLCRTVHETRDAFGADPVGVLIEGSHTSAHDIAGDAVCSIVDALDDLATRLTELAESEEARRLGAGELAAALDELVPPLLGGLPAHEVEAVEIHRLAGEGRETLENLFIALAGLRRPVPAPAYARLGVLADAVGLELPLLHVVPASADGPLHSA